MKNYIICNKKGIILVVLGVMILIVMLLLYHRCSQQEFLVSSISTFEAKINEPESKRILSEEELLEIYINDNLETINFFADVFKINRDTLVERLMIDYQSINLMHTENLEYTLTAYNKNGKEKEVQFKTSRELREGAYLELDIMQMRGVVNWREVQQNELPEDVKTAMNIE